MTPEGISEKQWRYYNMGRKAHEEGYGKEAAITVFEIRDRAWWYAGWIDRDIEQSMVAA